MIGTTQGLIDYAAARGVIIEPVKAPILLTKATDYLDNQCWVGEKQDPAQADSWPRILPGTDAGQTPDVVINASYRLAIEANAGVNLLPATAGKQYIKAAVSGAVSVEYDKDTIGAAPYFPWFDNMVGEYLWCDGMSGAQFNVGRG